MKMGKMVKTVINDKNEKKNFGLQVLTISTVYPKNL